MLGLYIHWPFCQAKCPYCDFNSHVSAQIDQKRWERAYLSELDRYAAETEGRVLHTIFFGGGTPSLMEPELVDAILTRVRQLWPMSNDPEITLEANPTSIEAGRFKGYRDAGVSRVSMGAQALNDEDLRALGRMHSVKEAMQAFDIARNTFDRVSFDLIYARQNQSLDHWKDELNQALSLAADHLSLYQLTIEDGTAFGDRFARGGLRGLPDDDLGADMYSLTQEITAKHGLPAYEISNHAKPGSESRHNLIYWRGGDWIGIGPGAHGRLTMNGTRWAIDTPKGPIEWLRQVEMTANGDGTREALTAEDVTNEYLMMALRLTEGAELSRCGDLSPHVLSELQDLGLIAMSGGRICATSAGRPVLNGILRELLVG